MLVGRILVDGDLVSLGYADVFVVVREGESRPGPNDWEVTVRTPSAHPLEPGVHVLELDALDGSRLSGRALLALQRRPPAPIPRRWRSGGLRRVVAC